MTVELAIETKKCSKCKEIFPANTEHFYAEKRYSSGLQARCKNCYNKAVKEYREKNKEIVKERNKSYFERNKERIKRRQSEYFQSNKDYFSEKNKKWREENKEKARQLAKDYAKKNPQKIREASERYIRNNKEIIAERSKRHRLENLEKYREYGADYRKKNEERIKRRMSEYAKKNRAKMNVAMQRRKARMKDLRFDFTGADWKECLDYFNHKCAYCSSEEKLSQDHFIPVYAGGHYSKENIIPACTRCNSSKCHREFNKWYSRQEYYSAERVLVIYEYLEKVAKTHETRRILPSRSESGQDPAR